MLSCVLIKNTIMSELIIKVVSECTEVSTVILVHSFPKFQTVYPIGTLARAKFKGKSISRLRIQVLLCILKYTPL